MKLDIHDKANELQYKIGDLNYQISNIKEVQRRNERGKHSDWQPAEVTIRNHTTFQVLDITFFDFDKFCNDYVEVLKGKVNELQKQYDEL